MKEMSSHERILSVYKNQMPDKTPLSIYKRYLPSGNLERELRNSGMGIIEYITADMTPPSSFEKYCLPYYQKHSKQAKSAEKPYLIHMDGKIKPLTNLLKKAGFDAIESVSIPEMGGDYTIEDAQKAFPEMVILPNFPSNWCLLSEENIIKNLVSFFEKLNPKRPIMLQVSEDIPATEWKRVLPIVTEFMKNQ